MSHDLPAGEYYRILAVRVRTRLEAVREREGSEASAYSGPGFAVGYQFGRELKAALERAADTADRFDSRVTELLAANSREKDARTAARNALRELWTLCEAMQGPELGDDPIWAPVMNAAATVLGEPTRPLPTRVWRHLKRGTTYAEIGRGTLQSSIPLDDYDNVPMVLYRAEVDGSLWCRPVAEFDDGRFEPLFKTER